MTLPLYPKSSKLSLSFIADGRSHTVYGQVAKALSTLVTLPKLPKRSAKIADFGGVA